MTELFGWILGVLLAAMLIEAVFRMMNRFSKESRELFRWVYVIGCGLTSVYVIVEAGKHLGSAWRWPDRISTIELAILVIAIIFTILINIKKDK